VGSGTGLGLAVSHRIIEEHGGWITAGNNPEGGAVFTLFIPVYDGPAVEENLKDGERATVDR
jgi:signal transduction histidine kinase